MLTKEQKVVKDSVLDRINISHLFDSKLAPFTITIGGYAGTGKTFLLGEIRKGIHKLLPNLSVAFVTFTGKASSILENKLIKNDARFEDDYVGTIHGLIYIPETIWDPKTNRQIIHNKTSVT